MWAAGVTFAAMVTKFLLKDFYFRDACNPTIPNDINCLPVDFVAVIKEILRFFIIAITIVVVAIPEGLPLAVTISLAYSVGKMRDENVLVRKLESAETMGGVDQICTDKTGTLTVNQMNTRGLYINGSVYIDESFNHLDIDKMAVRDLLGQAVLSNCSAYIEEGKDGKYEAKGNCTEQGLIRFFLD
jgi:magnesium-transporting ATPase (P-type)